MLYDDHIAWPTQVNRGGAEMPRRHTAVSWAERDRDCSACDLAAAGQPRKPKRNASNPEAIQCIGEHTGIQAEQAVDLGRERSAHL